MPTLKRRSAKKLEVEHRVVGVTLPGDEGAEHGRRGGEPAEGDGIGPAVVRRLDERPDQGGEADDRQHGADEVEPGLLGIA